MRAIATFLNRSSMYIQGILTEVEALKMFQTLGTVNRMQIYKDGKKITVYGLLEGWII